MSFCELSSRDVAGTNEAYNHHFANYALVTSQVPIRLIIMSFCELSLRDLTGTNEAYNHVILRIILS